MRRREERSMSVVKGESIIVVATRRVKGKGSNGHQHKDEGNLLSIPYSSIGKDDDQVNPLGFYTWTF